MLQQAAGVVERHLGQPGILVARKQRLALLPERLVGVHPRAIVAKERLGHEAGRLAVLARRRS